MPKSYSSLPNSLSNGDNLFGKVIDSEIQIFPSQSIHGHLSSNLDASLAINALSNDAVIIRDYPVKRESKTLPISMIDFWIRKQHPRMKEDKVIVLLDSVKSFLSQKDNSNVPISIQRALIRDFGDCRWSEEINHNIDIKGFSENGASSLIDYFLSLNSYDLIVEWIWPIGPHKKMLQKLIESRICRLLVTRSGEL